MILYPAAISACCVLLGENRCSSDGGGCSDICIENKSGNVTCLCQTGNSLNADGMTCNGDTISKNLENFCISFTKRI